MTLASVNVQCLSKYDLLQLFVNASKPDILCISEYWLDSSECDLFNDILILAGVWCRTSHRNGGTACYVNRTINNVVFVDLSQFGVDIDFKVCAVHVVD